MVAPAMPVVRASASSRVPSLTPTRISFVRCLTIYLASTALARLKSRASNVSLRSREPAPVISAISSYVRYTSINSSGGDWGVQPRAAEVDDPWIALREHAPDQQPCRGRNFLGRQAFQVCADEGTVLQFLLR